MSFRVLLVEDAEEDLFELYLYVLEADSQQAADTLSAGIEKACESLSELPFRGHPPPELGRIGLSDYREIHHKPYRIIYRVTGSDVHVHCILDGRRDTRDLLAERLLRGP